MNQVIDQAIEFLTNDTTTSPTPEAVVEALLIAEKTAKQTKVRHSYPQLLGTWRLGFITGTKRTRKRAGVILGAGQFIPDWVKIQLSYSQSEVNQERGSVQNAVAIGPLQLIVTGPTQFWQKTNILAFDFTQIKVSLSSRKLYEGYIPGGQNREANFWEKKLKDQAFFTYFLVDNLCIAARGRGGGLALWTKVK